MFKCPLCGAEEYREGVCSSEDIRINLCRSCGLGINFPRLEQKDVRQYYEQEYYQLSSNLQFDRSRLALYEKDFHVISSLVGGRRLLDYGCGLGDFLEMARGGGWQGTGIEISERAAGIAREKYGLDVRTGGAGALGDFPGEFDVITLWNVLDHVSAPIDLLRSLRACLKPDGVLVIRVLNYFSRSALYGLGNFFNINRIKATFRVFHEYAFTAKSIKMALTRCGYTEITVKNSAMAGESAASPGKAFIVKLAEHGFSLFNILSFRKVFIAPSLLIIARNGK